MSEKNERTDDLVRIPVTRHLWKDERDQKELKELKKTHRITSILLYVFLGISLILTGVTIGLIRNRYQPSATVEEKLRTVMDVMINDWYFGKEIEGDKEQYFLDQAIRGVTTNDIDVHTTYMSSEELDSFYQGINRNFVGIGVQYFTTEDGVHIIKNVFKDSPAEKAGLLPGDMIYAVDGTIVEGLNSDNVSDLVRGEEGKVVHIEVHRDLETVAFDIVRAPVATTVTGSVMDDSIGYLGVMQFGETTANEMKGYINDFLAKQIDKLIIDLRDDGGGFLTSLQGVGGLFLPSSAIVIQEEYADGTVEKLNAVGQPVWTDKDIVILVNENTASAAEAFALAMRENYGKVTIVGTQTFGKGTVQNSRQFSDGSAIKFTSSRWLSPNGLWINGEGVTPDEVVVLHEMATSPYYFMEEGEKYEVDQVSEFVHTAQSCLDYLEYDIDRTDGYFSTKTQEVISLFQETNGLDVTGVLDDRTYEKIIYQVIYDWNTSYEHDTQLNRAKEILHG